MLLRSHYLYLMYEENRQRINELLMLSGSVEDKVINRSNHLEQEIKRSHDHQWYCFQGLISL